MFSLLHDSAHIILKPCTKPLLLDVNYDRVNDDYTNALRPRRFK